MLLCLFSYIYTPHAEAQTKLNDVSVTYNGKAISFPDAKPFIDKEGRVQVPIRYIGQALNLTVDYSTSGNSRTAVFSNQVKRVEFVLNTNSYYVDHKLLKMDTTSQVISNRTYTPARYLAEQFGATVTWDKTTRTVSIVQSNSGNVTPLPAAVTGELAFTTDAEALQRYHVAAVGLLKQHGEYMSNREQAIKQFEQLTTVLISDKVDRTQSIERYKMKSTAKDYGWTSEHVKSYISTLTTLSTADPLTTQVFTDKNSKVLSYRHSVKVNQATIWLEVQFTFKLVKDNQYNLVAIKA